MKESHPFIHHLHNKSSCSFLDESPSSFRCGSFVCEELWGHNFLIFGQFNELFSVALAQLCWFESAFTVSRAVSLLQCSVRPADVYCKCVQNVPVTEFLLWQHLKHHNYGFLDVSTCKQNYLNFFFYRWHSNRKESKHVPSVLKRIRNRKIMNWKDKLSSDEPPLLEHPAIASRIFAL